MDLMEVRRGLLTSMSGKVPRLIFGKTITFEETATNVNRKNIQLPIIKNGFICILIDELPAEPDSEIYIALTNYMNVITDYESFGGSTNILRPNGTIGSDSGGSSYNRSTGVLSLGGSYSYYLEGTKYNIYAFEIGESA